MNWILRRYERSDRAREALPSLGSVHPSAGQTTRLPVSIETVPVRRIVGTVREPSGLTADFLPTDALQHANWRFRWKRIQDATDALEVLPPVDLLRVGDEYFVVDGHHRVAAALQAGVAEIDANVTTVLVSPNASRASDLFRACLPSGMVF